MAKQVKLLLVERNMKKKDLSEKLGTSLSSLSRKLSRDNLTEKDLQEIAKACDATFVGGFVLNDTGKEIK